MTDPNTLPATGDGETLVVKLGGSVVTEKDQPETVDEDTLFAVAAALSESSTPSSSPARLVVVHGGGSFGHYHAETYGIDTATGTHDAAGALAITEAMRELNQAVVTALQNHGLSALPVHPLSVASRDGRGTLSLPTTQVERLLGEGFVPVLHGDVIVHEGEGVTVLSGDELVVELATAVRADRVGVCSTVPGVLDDDGAVIERVQSFADVADVLGASESTDVTGGMAGKVRALSACGVPAQVFGPDDVRAFVAGESPGTTVDGG